MKIKLLFVLCLILTAGCVEPETETEVETEEDPETSTYYCVTVDNMTYCSTGEGEKRTETQTDSE